MNELDPAFPLDSENLRFEYFNGKYQGAGQERNYFQGYLCVF